MKLRLIFLALFVVMTQWGIAQVVFESMVSKKKVEVDGKFSVDFKMNKEGDNFISPDFKGFTILRGPSRSITNSYVSGEELHSTVYSYDLRPTEIGSFVIEEATVEIDGQEYKTSPIKIEVVAAGPKPEDNIDRIINENLHVVAEVSKTNPYLNEGITVIYKLYVSSEIGVTNLGEIDEPKYHNFWSQSIKIDSLKVEKEEYKGTPYNYVVFGKTLLCPLKTGTLEIDPLALSLIIQVPTSKRDFFGNKMLKKVKKTIAGSSTTINVKSLPEPGKPANFSGAVGSFDFKVIPNRTELNAAESLETKIIVSGNGNLNDIEVPKLRTPNGLKHTEPEHKENVETNISGMNGNIVDSYTLVPQFKGSYLIPPVSFSYFDLKTEAYKTISSKGMIIDVKNGPDREKQ